MGKSKSPAPTAQESNYYAEELARNVTPRFNLGTQMLVTTRDKIENCLLRNESALRAQRDWIAPLGILLTLITTLVSATFHEALGVRADVWQAFFGVAVVAVALWLIVAILNVIRCWKRASVDWLVAQLCADNVEAPMQEAAIPATVAGGPSA